MTKIKRRILLAILLFLAGYGILVFALFEFGLAGFLSKSFARLDGVKHLSLWNVTIVGSVSVMFAIAGYFTAKKRGRGARRWLAVCLLTNLWGYIVLLLLPSVEQSLGGHRGRS